MRIICSSLFRPFFMLTPLAPSHYFYIASDGKLLIRSEHMTEIIISSRRDEGPNSPLVLVMEWPVHRPHAVKATVVMGQCDNAVLATSQ